MALRKLDTEEKGLLARQIIDLTVALAKVMEAEAYDYDWAQLHRSVYRAIGEASYILTNSEQNPEVCDATKETSGGER